MTDEKKGVGPHPRTDTPTNSPDAPTITVDVDAALAAAVAQQTPEQREALIAKGKEISESGKYWPPAQPYVEYVPPVFADVLALDRAHRQKMKRALG